MNKPETPNRVASSAVLDDASVEDFPTAARHFLTAFYKAKSATTEDQKAAALRQAYNLENAVITAGGLKVLEFYALTKQGII